MGIGPSPAQRRRYLPDSKGGKLYLQGAGKLPAQPYKKPYMYHGRMRSKSILDTAKNMAEVAQAIAVAGLGLRGTDARAAMREARRRTMERLERTRWEAIVRAARATRFNAVGEDEHDSGIIIGDAAEQSSGGAGQDAGDCQGIHGGAGEMARCDSSSRASAEAQDSGRGEASA